jgi:hypothetical protein
MDKPLMPGQRLMVGEQSLEIIELTSELRDQLKLAGPVRAVVILLVESVEFADGSVFNDRKTVKALEGYFVDINSEEINSRANPNSGVPSKPTKEP